MSRDFPALFFSYRVLREVLKEKKFVRDIFENFSRKNEEFRKNLPLITELVYGTLRYWHQIDFILSALLKRKKVKDVRVKILLSLGIYQILYTETPDAKAVFSTVELCKNLFSKETGNFANALLKKFMNEKEEILNRIESLPREQYLEIKYSFPSIFVENIRYEKKEEILELLNKPAPLYLKPVPGVSTLSEIILFLKEVGVTYSVCDFPPECVRTTISTTRLLENLGDKMIIQDRGAQIISWLLRGIPDGKKVLDCCTAPGWKTMEILRGGEKKVVVVEKSEKRLRSFRTFLKKGNFRNVEIVIDSMENASSRLRDKFDFAIADVPCSNSGVVRRHPEKKLFLNEKTLFSLVSQQRKILSSIYGVLNRGGILLYITCSLFQKENEDQVRWMTSVFPDIEILSEGYIYPFSFDSDGFFLALMRKK